METALTIKDVSKIEDCALNVKQLNVLLGGTPKGAIYERVAKGGGTWKYVTGTYVKKVLNLTFGFDWNFEIVKYEYDLTIGQVFVHGRLTVHSGGKTIIKEQFGRQDIKFKNNWKDGQKIKTQIPLDLGNDLKASTTDALKKCASELGIASDVYAPNEFKSVRIVEDKQSMEEVEETIRQLLATSNGLSELDYEAVEKVLRDKEFDEYHRTIINLKKHQDESQK